MDNSQPTDPAPSEVTETVPPKPTARTLDSIPSLPPDHPIYRNGFWLKLPITDDTSPQATPEQPTDEQNSAVLPSPALTPEEEELQNTPYPDWDED